MELVLIRREFRLLAFMKTHNLKAIIHYLLDGTLRIHQRLPHVSTHSLSVAGYVLLTYRSVFQLSSDKSRLPEILESLSIKWIILLLYIHFEGYIESVMDLLPLGTLAVLVIKSILILPENTLATLIYKRIEKQMEKIEFE